MKPLTESYLLAAHVQLLMTHIMTSYRNWEVTYIMSTSSFYIDRSSSIPLYEQLRSSIADAISRGDKKPIMNLSKVVLLSASVVEERL